MLVFARSSVARVKKTVFSLDNDLHGSRQTAQLDRESHLGLKATQWSLPITGINARLAAASDLDDRLRWASSLLWNEYMEHSALKKVTGLSRHESSLHEYSQKTNPTGGCHS
jgi:hypothetical protein